MVTVFRWAGFNVEVANIRAAIDNFVEQDGECESKGLLDIEGGIKSSVQLLGMRKYLYETHPLNKPSVPFNTCY